MEDDPPIDVVAASAEHLRAFLAGPEALHDEFGLGSEEDLDLFPGAMETSLTRLEAGADSRWHTHLFVDVERRQVVGFGGFIGGFKGPPQAGAVEVGYAVAPAACGRGVATAALRRLVECARRQGASRGVAHTLPEPNPSTAVLERCGFTLVGEVVGPDGPVWRWELAWAEPLGAVAAVQAGQSERNSLPVTER